MNRSVLRSFVLLLAAFTLLFGQLEAGAQSPQSAAQRTLEGAWWVDVTVYTSCSSLEVKSSFSSLLLFSRGGTLTEVTSNPTFMVGQRSSGIGTWSVNANGSYTASDTAYILFSGGPFVKGTQRLGHSIKLTKSGNKFSDIASIQFFDANGLPLMSGCASAQGKRLL